MADTTITSANASFILTIASLYPAGVQLQNWSADSAWSSDAVEQAQVMMSVDGIMSAGYTPNPTVMTLNLMADSTSRKYFNELIIAQRTQNDIYWLTGAITLDSTGESYALTRGALTSGKLIPDAAKVLQPTTYVITWESVAQS